MERENIFDEEFCRKLKAFYSFEEGDAKYPEKYIKMGGSYNIGYRRTGRTKVLAKVLLETAIESNREIVIQDHYNDICGVSNSNLNLKREIQNLVSEYRDIGVHINYEFHNRFNNRFKAGIMEGRDIYSKERIEPFPIKFIEKKEEFLERRKLLLLK